jgi:5-methyltetrahydrofolate--homocysteine methyltransferase
MPEPTLLEQLSENVQYGRVKEVASLVQQCLDSGLSAQSVLDNGLLHGLDRLSILFRNSEIFIAELLQASKAMNVGMSMLKKQLASEGMQLRGRAVIATVEGDLHDIGKNLVKYMLEGVGVEVIDLGADVTTEQILAAVKEHKPNVLALSSLLTTTMERQREIIDALKAAGLRNRVKVVVGGAPITVGFSRSIGADGYAVDASAAVDIVKNMLLESRPVQTESNLAGVGISR